MEEKYAAQVAKLNDAFRRKGLGFMITPGIKELEDITGLISAVREFDTFNEGNDPHGEHDFGTIVWYGQKVFWKIDYYDPELVYGEEPLLSDCRRVLTVMLASEY